MTNLLEDCRQCEADISSTTGMVTIEHESVPHWQEKLAISIGMATQEALEKFLVWQENKKTCERCGGKEYFEYCPVRLVCREAMALERGEVKEDGNREELSGEVDNRSRPYENFRLEEVGIG